MMQHRQPFLKNWQTSAKKHPRPHFRCTKHILLITALLITVSCLSGCRSYPVAENPGLYFSTANPDTVLVSEIIPHRGVRVETYRNREYPLIWHLVTIDLSDPELAIIAEPLSSETYGCTEAETTQDFARRTGALVAINATPFSVPDDKPFHATAERKLEGLFISDGVQFSDPKAQYGALGFTQEKRAFVMESQDFPLPEDAAFVFGGFWVILKDGEHYDSFKAIQDSRMAAGISADGMTLFLLCVEGERPVSSRGLTYYDCAEILLNAGAENAVQLDGGGSISLIIQENNMLSFPQMRKVANNFGIYVTIGID